MAEEQKAQTVDFKTTFRELAASAPDADTPFFGQLNLSGAKETFKKFSLKELVDEVENNTKVGKGLKEALETEAEDSKWPIQAVIGHFVVDKEITVPRRLKSVVPTTKTGNTLTTIEGEKHKHVHAKAQPKA